MVAKVKINTRGLAIGDKVSAGMILSVEGTGTVTGHKVEIEFWTSADASISKHGGNSQNQADTDNPFLSKVEDVTIPATTDKISVANVWSSKGANADPTSELAKLVKGEKLTPFGMSQGRMYMGTTDPDTYADLRYLDVWFDTN